MNDKNNSGFKLEITDVFKAIETAIPVEVIEQVLSKTKAKKMRNRSFPAQLVVCLIIAMSFWSRDSMKDVLLNLVDGLTDVGIKVAKYWKCPCKSAITQARQRLGPQVMSRLFYQLVQPVATKKTWGSFLQEYRVVVIDGTCFNLPDSQENLRVFGKPACRPSVQAAFPKLRLVILIEAGTHIIFDALMCPYRFGERARAIKLLRSVTEEMLLMWDRGLHSYAMVLSTVEKRSQYLGRIPSNVKFKVEKTLKDGSYISQINPDGKLRKKGYKPIKLRIIEYTIKLAEDSSAPVTYRLITSLLDEHKFPASLLASEYHQRWEVENTIGELKTHLLGRKTQIRSQKPREVVQEVYGWLLAHWAIRSLMFQAAEQAEIPPNRLSFTGTLKIIRRALPKFQRVQEEELPFFSIG